MALLLTDNNTDLVRDKDIRNQETGAAKYKKKLNLKLKLNPDPDISPQTMVFPFCV